MLKESGDRLRGLYNVSSKFFNTISIKYDICQYLQKSKIHRKVVRELNEGIFGGNEACEDMFMDNIDNHISELLLIFKKMMTLIVNFINPQNMTYILKTYQKDKFHLLLGMLFKLQCIVCILESWYSLQKDPEDKEKAVKHYSSLFELLLMFDFMGNQQGGLLQSSFQKFLVLYFNQILWICTYFRRNHPEIEYLDTTLFRTINQIHGIDLAEEARESEEEDASEALTIKRGRKPKSFYTDNEETPDMEIQNQLKSYDAVRMTSQPQEKSSDSFEIAMLLDLLVNHSRYS